MRQQALFRFEGDVVPGFSLHPDYIDAATERALLEAIDREPWETDWRRRIQQYGLGYASRIGGEATWVRDFPEWLLALAQRIVDDGVLARFPENVVVNDYAPGVGIGPHRDYRTFGPTVAAVSLGSGVVLDLVTPDRDRRVSTYVPPRSLWIITGEARAQWLHAIAARKSDVVDGVRIPRGRRVSITFRTAANAARASTARLSAASTLHAHDERDMKPRATRQRPARPT